MLRNRLTYSVLFLFTLFLHLNAYFLFFADVPTATLKSSVIYEPFSQLYTVGPWLREHREKHPFANH